MAMIPNNGQDSPAETLARSILSRIESVSAKLRDLEADIRQLWVEFEKLKDGETILGCRTKKEFCEKKLNRSPRTVQYLLAGQSNPADRPRSELSSPLISNRQIRHQAVIAAHPEMKNATPRELDAMAYQMHLRKNPPALETTLPQTVENAPHASPVDELRQLISERKRQRPSDPSLDRRKNRDDIKDFNELQDYAGLIFQLGYEEVRRSTNHFITHGSLLDSAFTWGKSRLAEEKTSGRLREPPQG